MAVIGKPAETALPLRVLLVDGDDDTRKMYSEYLELTAWLIEEAGDGREALAKAIATQPDVIVTETRIPGINGYELCNLLRRDAATASIPIIVVTADAFAGDLARARDAGADTVLAKPCLPEALGAELRRVLEQSSARRQKSRTLRDHVQTQGDRVDVQLARAEDRLIRSQHAVHNISLKRAHHRGDTTIPPVPPPALVCPNCDHSLVYQRSHIGGVSSKHQEQWDYFECPGGCGTFQYRTRTRKLRKV
jgi:CheY-like chemotaxis protein